MMSIRKVKSISLALHGKKNIPLQPLSILIVIIHRVRCTIQCFFEGIPNFNATVTALFKF